MGERGETCRTSVKCGKGYSARGARRARGARLGFEVGELSGLKADAAALIAWCHHQLPDRVEEHLDVHVVTRHCAL